MDATAFGLSRDPFQRSSDLDDACLPNPLSALLSELQSGLRCSQGVSVLLAESGSGKSLLARTFARRLCGVARAAVIEEPASSVSSIARDALASLGDPAAECDGDVDWPALLRDHAARRAAQGSVTVVILDGAERLSPGCLEDLAGLFEDGEDLGLHVFLFGRPALLDRINAGADRALLSHLLQIVRLEPLGVRESVRYLERRLAMSGGELGRLFDDDAVEEIVGLAQGRLLRLEELAVAALTKASSRGATRALAADVDIPHAAVPGAQVARREVQQALDFEVAGADIVDEEAVVWGDAEESAEWADAAEDEGLLDDRAMAWDGDELDREDPLVSGHLEDDDDEEGEIDAGPAARRRRAGRGPAREVETEGPPGRSRVAGRVVLSVAACFALVWLANHLPGSSGSQSPGRDALLFAEPLADDPAGILRLAASPEDADADAHLATWRQAGSPLPASAPLSSREDALASLEPPGGAAGAARVALAEPAPQGRRPGSEAAPAVKPSVKPAPAATPRKATGQPAAVQGAASRPSAPTAARPAPASRATVYTVQLGAFKTRRNAEEMVARLRGRPTRILLESGLYRVVSGSFETRSAALAHEGSLKKAGYSTFVRTAVF